MHEQTLELRGIRISHLLTYLVECGGEIKGQAADEPGREDLPLVVCGNQWEAELMREETVTITSRFHVNAVFIRFTSEREDVLTQLLQRFRIKVIRVGG
ncbi:MAG TPA: hypothetical protein VEZ13_19275 [Brevibacillus sp.]|nr:hypothetical protein [Brevibacillus sp.]